MSTRTNAVKDTIEILIAEDSPTQAEASHYVLQQAGYRVTVARDGRQALASLSGTKPALVISDITMPEVNGYELSQHIRADERTRDIPVILLTGLSETQDVLEGMACGADSFITKPYSDDYLLAHVERTLADRYSIPRSWRDMSAHPRDHAAIQVEIPIQGKSRVITVDPRRMVSLLLSTYEAAVHRNSELNKTQEALSSLNEHLEDLVEQRTAALAAEIAERQQTLEQLRLTSEELQASETRQRTVVEADASGLVVLDREGVIRFVNPAAQVLLGRSREQLLGEPFGFPVAAGAATELELLRPGERQTTVEMRVVEIEWDGVPCFLALLQDITERKQAEEAEKELAQMKDDFVANVSHQLRTPLHSLKGYLGLLCQGQVREPSVRQEFLTRSVEATERLIVLANNLLDVFRLESGHMQLEMQELDLRALIANTVESLNDLAAEKGIAITHATPDTDVFLYGDAHWLGEALTNLIHNACKFSEPGCPIQVTAEVSNGRATIRVIDQGPGIPAEAQPRLFDLFYQVESAAKRAGRGSGLGLSVAKGIIRAHGGQIGVLSEPGKGNTFFFTLPVLNKGERCDEGENPGR